MDLKDFEKSTSRKKFESLNSRLKKQFGVSITESATPSDLKALLKVTNESIQKAKMNGKTINSDADLARNVLMKEAIISRMGEIPQDGLSKQEKIYNEIIDGLASYVDQCIELGDSFDEALDSAMKEYRSSPYRFSDESVRSDVSVRVNQESNTYQMDGEMEQNKQIREGFVKELRTLLESEVEEAEIVIATKGFSKSLQEMIEKVGRLQNEDLPPLSDQMRASYNIDVAHNFHEKTQGTLQSVLDSLYYAKDEIDRVVQNMAVGNLHWDTDMESDSDELEGEPDLDGELDIDPSADMGDVEGEVDDIDSELADLEGELDDEPLGRIKKESLERIRTRLTHLKEQVERAKARK